MTEQYKKGDRVKVTIEGIVDYVSVLGAGYDLVDDNGGPIPGVTHAGRNGVVSIEKLEPPVEVFGPGDVIQERRLPQHKYVLTRDGWTHIDTECGLASHRMYSPAVTADYFTSERYERVSLG